MPDKQIHPTGDVSAPADYVISPSAELLLKMAFAKFDGTGAAGAFKPCLRIISDAGTVAGEAVADDEVAAGASADVTWFPRVGGGGGASTGVQWCYCSRVTSFTLTTGANGAIPWTHFVTSDPSVFTITTVTRPDDTVMGNSPGVYIASAQTAWTPAAYQRRVNINTSFFGVSHVVQTPVSDTATATTPTGQGYLLHDAITMISQSVPGSIAVNAANLDVVSRSVVSAFLMVAFLPNAALVT